MVSYSIICQESKTPLHWAAERGSIECVNALMQHADIGAALMIQDNVSYNYLNVFDDAYHQAILLINNIKYNITCT